MKYCQYSFQCQYCWFVCNIVSIMLMTSWFTTNISFQYNHYEKKYDYFLIFSNKERLSLHKKCLWISSHLLKEILNENLHFLCSVHRNLVSSKFAQDTATFQSIFCNIYCTFVIQALLIESLGLYYVITQKQLVDRNLAFFLFCCINVR